MVCFLDREKRQDGEEDQMERINLPAGGVLPTLFNGGKKIRLLRCLSRTQLVLVFKHQFLVFIKICVDKKMCKNTYNII